MASDMLARFATLQVNALPQQEHVRGIILREPFLGQQEEDSTGCSSLRFTTADVVVESEESTAGTDESSIRFATLLEATVMASKQVHVPDPAIINDHQLYYEQSKRFVLEKPQWACWLAGEWGVSEEEEE